MQLVYFSVLLSAFLGAISNEWLRIDATEFSLSWWLGGITLLGIIGKYTAARARNRIESTGKLRVPLAELEKQHRIILWFWIAISPLFLSMIGWGAYTQELLPGVDSLAWTFAWWCFPSILLMTLLEAARGQIRRSYRVASLSGIRYGWLVLILPCLATCLLWDVAIGASQRLVGVDQTSPIAIACLLTLIMAFMLPFLMLKLWNTERLGKTPQDRLVISTWVAAGGDPRLVRRWKTNASIAGAMVLGWNRRTRCLLLSDVLLERLDLDELRMIVLHEAAHGRRWHVWLRMMPVWAMAIPIIAVHHHSWSNQILQVFPLPSSFLLPSVVVGSLVMMCVMLSWIARWTEFDADKFSVELAAFLEAGPKSNPIINQGSTSQRSTFSQQMAARALIRALRKLTPASHVSKETWLHPSLDRRVKSLNQRYFYDPSLLVESVDDVGCLSSPL